MSLVAAADFPPTFSMVIVQNLGSFDQQTGGTGVDSYGIGDGVLKFFHGNTSFLHLYEFGVKWIRNHDRLTLQKDTLSSAFYLQQS
jgi:hypothetical protein